VNTRRRVIVHSNPEPPLACLCRVIPQERMKLDSNACGQEKKVFWIFKSLISNITALNWRIVVMFALTSQHMRACIQAG